MKKVEIDKSACIGCGACVQIDGDVFTYGDDGLSEVKKEIVDDDDQNVIMAEESCPTSAIKVIDADGENCHCGSDCHCKGECNCPKNEEN